MHTFVHDQLTTISNEEQYINIFYSKSEASALKLKENLEDMFTRYYMY